MNGDYLSNHSFPYTKEAPHEIGAALDSEKLFEILNIFPIQMWGQYECIGKQTWPHRKKVKCQCTTIILATLVDLLSPKIWAKIQPQDTSVLEKKIFEGFTIYGHGGHLGQRTATILAIFYSPN